MARRIELLAAARQKAVVSSFLLADRQVEDAMSKPSISMPSTEAGPGWPTWFQTKSIPPSAFAASRTMRRLSSSRVRSAGIPTARPPADSISTTATAVPSLANRTAPAHAIPEPAGGHDSAFVPHSHRFVILRMTGSSPWLSPWLAPSSRPRDAKAIKRADTASGCSCWTQCPAPSTSQMPAQSALL